MNAPPFHKEREGWGIPTSWTRVSFQKDERESPARLMPHPAPCYHATVFNFGKPKTAGDWIVHVAGAIVALFLVWWMLRAYVL